jgi:hypothetical protein
MSQEIELQAPNGTKFTLPTGLFINNEFVKGAAEPIVSIDPACVPAHHTWLHID